MDSIQYLLSIETRGIKLGIKRTLDIMDACGNPHAGMPSIQVAGTNGKGSVCAILANIFRAEGYKTGLFTSPHLINVNERIRINGVSISNNDIHLFIQKYKIVIEKINATFFETITAMAFWYFKKESVDVAILETGLGGRLDSVSICEPIATIITPISIDHIEVLGDSLQKIAFEKAGVLKKGVECISAKQEKSAADVLIDQANKKGCPLSFINGKSHSEYIMNIPGKHQQENAHLSVSALSHIKQFNFSKNSISKGLLSVKWYGRNQVIQNNPHVIFDVAHNTAGIKSFLDYYNSLKIIDSSVLIIALQSRKHIESVIPILTSTFKFIVCTETGGQNPMPADKLGRLFTNYNINIITKPEEAILWGLKKLSNNGAMAIIGTHYLGPAVSNVFKISFDNY
jgi:dihydrofolate synthase/folylpolyglutamate synthase